MKFTYRALSNQGHAAFVPLWHRAHDYSGLVSDQAFHRAHMNIPLICLYRNTCLSLLPAADVCPSHHLAFKHMRGTLEEGSQTLGDTCVCVSVRKCLSVLGVTKTEEIR